MSGDGAAAYVKRRRWNPGAPVVFGGEMFVNGHAVSGLDAVERLALLEEQDWTRRPLELRRGGRVLRVR